MKILVAGGAGYVGSVLVPDLLAHGYDTTVIDLLWFGNHLPKEAEIIRKDLFKCTEEDFRGFDQVIFLAGLSNDPMAEYSPAMNFTYNAALPAYLAYIAKKSGVKRFVYGSSCSIYGYTVDEMYDEESPTTCSYPYGISKLQGEDGVMQLKDEEFSVISLRNGTVCGHSPRMRFDLIVNTMFKAALTKGKITVNNPSIWRPVVHIDDEVGAYIRAVQANYAISGIYNIASDNWTVGQVGDLVKYFIEKKLKKDIKLEIKDIKDFRNYKVTIDKAKTYLGFQPMFNIEDIVAGLIEHRAEYGDFEKEQYYNIKVFKKLLLEEKTR
jgi:nucleoside-diphosphate-sugar epimerase